MAAPIYFDHAATSWPKPSVVPEAVGRYFGDAGGNPGRSGHRMSIAAAQLVEEARDRMATLLGVADPARVAFTKNATEALNVAIYGMVPRGGGHVVTTSCEHNSVMRPLRHLESLGTEVTVVPGDATGMIDASAVAAALRPDSSLVVTVHGSNVTGALLPVAAISAAARDRGVPYLVDASQTAGAIPIDCTALGIPLLAFTGHKALLGPTGTGGLVVGEGITVPALLRGGTGSRSDLEVQPDFLPDSLESGTLNVAGLAGLGAAAGHLLSVGVDQVAVHERGLVDRFRRGAGGIAGVVLYGPDDPELRCGVVSFNVSGLSCSEVGTMLDRDFDIMSRVGLHCSPGSHRTIGTFPTGTVRFGFGLSNSTAEVDTAVAAIAEIAAWAVTREPDHA
ncbi:MAG TPA: aminotransferase class V-fold PLP-dependent enzyme [Acidimicrobiia bacterium]|nr:aminotransferase class V-fold PLP-dependent enzyme [Acidimicrobiia bacterium]